MNVFDEHSRSLWMTEVPVAKARPLAGDAQTDVCLLYTSPSPRDS